MILKILICIVLFILRLRQILLFIIGLDHDGNVPVKTLIIYAVIPFFVFLSLFCFKERRKCLL